MPLSGENLSPHDLVQCGLAGRSAQLCGVFSAPQPTLAGSEVVVARGCDSRHRSACRRLAQPLSLACAAQHMCSESSRASDVPFRGAGLDQPTIVKRGVELATPRFNPLDGIAQLLQT